MNIFFPSDYHEIKACYLICNLKLLLYEHYNILRNHFFNSLNLDTVKLYKFILQCELL